MSTSFPGAEIVSGSSFGELELESTQLKLKTLNQQHKVKNRQGPTLPALLPIDWFIALLPFHNTVYMERDPLCPVSYCLSQDHGFQARNFFLHQDIMR